MSPQSKMNAKPIQIVGGGLAGLTLGIALRKKEIPVTIFEAGQYPRHRVCGEFISGRGLKILDALGLKQKFLEAGAVRAESAAFFLESSGTPIRRLPVPALCLSRFVMDKLLADDFQKRGGELHSGTRWSPVGVQASAGPDTLKGEPQSEGVVCASGRRPQPVEDGWRWFGLKAHAKNVPLAADLEMHVGRHGYVGLCRLAGGEVNVCGLFRRNKLGRGQPGRALTNPKLADEPSALRPSFDLLRGNPGSVLQERLAHADFDESSFCSVAGLSLQPWRASDKSGCCIGDALTMIPPVTGNGMSVAFESAQLAAGPLAAYSRGDLSWPQARETIARSCDAAFSRRLGWAQWLHTALFSPLPQNVLFAFASRSGWFWRLAFKKTR
jgi:menaquinone-9 beta-reductase